ncbi:MAG: cupin domain-containing protein [Gemmatimonadales bacterium]|nr:cupin domain-containing protein [Gemmatimonadales bacterium]
MYVIPQNRPTPTPFDGIEHATWACSDDGLQHLSIWRQSLAPGACTPPHRHDIEEVVLCEAGSGEVHIDGVAHPFGAGSTLVLPGEVVHQIFSTGEQPLEILGIFPGTPVAVYLPDGQAIDPPWRS